MPRMGVSFSSNKRMRLGPAGDELFAPAPPTVFRKGILMKAVILCGGKGTRLREETEFRPKPMLPIGDRPILWHIMKTYAAHGIRDFILCLGYKGDIIRDYFRNYLWNSGDVTLSLGQE